MSLYLIGIGLCDENDISVRGLDLIRHSDFVFLESYTSFLQTSLEELESFCGKKIKVADRAFVEQKSEEILALSRKKKVALLVIGDPFSATTHVELYLSALKQGIKVEVVNNASVLTAVGKTGLQLYKFGKTASIPFPDARITYETPYNVIRDNQKIGAHTLLLLDLDPLQNRSLSVGEAIGSLFKVEESKKQKVFTKDTLCVVCARLGCRDEIIKSGTARQLAKLDFGKPPFCLIVPGKMHFLEEDAIEFWKS